MDATCVCSSKKRNWVDRVEHIGQFSHNFHLSIPTTIVYMYATIILDGKGNIYTILNFNVEGH